MMFSFPHLRAPKLAAALVAAMALAACSSTGNQAGLAGGSATPGSPQDFVVNVGDRVFFETDQTDLTSTATATLDKQAQWLTQYSAIPSPSRGMRTSAARANTTSLGARRAQAVRDYLFSRGIAARASAPSPTARNAPLPYATTSRASRRTAAPSPCSTALPAPDGKPGAGMRPAPIWRRFRVRRPLVIFWPCPGDCANETTSRTISPGQRPAACRSAFSLIPVFPFAGRPAGWPPSRPPCWRLSPLSGSPARGLAQTPATWWCASTA